MPPTIEELTEKRVALKAECSALLKAADDAKRDLSDDETKKFDANIAEINRLDANVKRRSELQTVEARGTEPMPRKTQPADIVEVGETLTPGKPPKIWKNFGEQLQAIASSYQTGRTDERIQKQYLAVSGASAGVPSDGGFLIHTDFSNEIWRKAHAAAVLASRCGVVPISEMSDSLEVPYIDESSRVTGSRWGGVRVYRGAEADSATAQKPKFGKWELRLEDMIGLAYVTERELADAPAVQEVFNIAFTEEFAWKIDNEILVGTGSGQCLGINPPLGTTQPLISIAKETGQAANTVVFNNIVKMWARLWAPSRGNAIWLINQDVEPALYTMSLAVGTGGIPVYLPAGGLSASPYATLMGRSVVPIEQCATLGTLGDIYLADFSQYVLITKGGLQADQSIHVRFINNERTFRFLTRINGQPKWKTALTPANGTNTLSPFITLAARA